MSKDLMFSFWVFCGFFCQVVCIVPAPTNISVVCQNLVNVLYWNYSKPTEHLEFLVTVESYIGEIETLRTAQMYQDISEYSSDLSDSYYVTVRAHDGQEESNKVSNKFTYSKDFADDITPNCSVDFPAINTSVRKDVIKVFFSHPYNIYEQNSLLVDFQYRITHNREVRNHICFEEEELCTEDIHLDENLTGKCVELKFEGMVGVLFTTTYKNVCVSEIRNDTIVDNLSYFAAIVGGGVVILFIFMGFMWFLWKKWSKIPKIPEILISIFGSQRSTTVIHSPQTIHVSKVCNVPLLKQQEFEACDSPTISPLEKVTTIIPTETEVMMVPETSAASSEEDVNFEESEDYSKSSDYDRPKFLQEMSPGDFTTGYGPRPPVLQVRNVCLNE